MKLFLKISILWLALALGLVGCSSESVKVDDVNKSVLDIRKSIIAIMGEPRAISSNGREFYSPYFSRKPLKNMKVENAPERLYALLTVLGDRRPYDVSVQVFSEQKDKQNGGYSEPEYEPEMTAKIARELKDKLNQSPKSINVIDDFKAF